MTGIPAEVFAGRRDRIFERLGRGVMVLPAAPVTYRSRDTEHRYRPDSELFWATGAIEPGIVAVLVGGEEPAFALFVPDPDPEAELWSGPRSSPEEAAERFGADETRPTSELSERLPPLLWRGDRAHWRLGRGGALEGHVLDAVRRARARGSRKGSGPRGVIDPGEVLDDLRLVKDRHELHRIREASRLTVAGHRAALAHARPGAGEWSVEAAVDSTFRSAGAEGPGFPTIVGSGPNACFLHYTRNSRRIEDGDLVLVDAGAEVGLYHGDVTRTFPAGGRFTPEQRAVYEVVAAAGRAALVATRPGAPASASHDAAVRVLVEGLIELGVVEGPVDDAIEARRHKPYFPHQTSHWLGLDVHDVGDYARRGTARPLEPGMTLTVEPGLYFRPGVEGGAARFAGIGVRIEDDVVVTAGGVENLTGSLATEPDAVEALAGGRG